MNLNLIYYVKNNRAQVIMLMFYLAIAFLVVTIFSYGIFSFKIYFQNQKIDELNKKIALYGSNEQKDAEKKVLDYKKAIDDFTVVIGSHRISTALFNFIEEHTLPQVWFSGFDIREEKYEVSLVGESADLEILSNQVNMFENSQGYIQHAALFDSQIVDGGRIKFSIKLSLDPSIFKYQVQK